MLEIDGSFGEGGGQVLRTTLALCALTGQGAHIHRIRARRAEPGLAPQHITAVAAAAEICAADVQGAYHGSTDLVFVPGSAPRAGRYVFDVTDAAVAGSAGSTTLVFQTVLLPLAAAFGVSHLTLRGGTHVPWSPPFDHLAEVFVPLLAEMGLPVRCRLESWGFYPTGGGQISADIYGPGSLPGMAGDAVEDRAATGGAGAEDHEREPAPIWQPHARGRLPAVVFDPLALLERGRLLGVTGVTVACNLPAHIAQRMADRARNALASSALHTQAEITPHVERGTGPGAFIFLHAEYEGGAAGFSALGYRGKPAEEVADEVCQQLLAFDATASPVDMHLADQILLPLALAAGRSQFRTARVTRHLLTNAHVIEQFLPAAINIQGVEGRPAVEGSPGIVTVEPKAG